MIAALIKLRAKLDSKIMKVKRGKLAALNGTMPVAKMQIAVVSVENRYHFLRLSVVSTNGAQTNLNTCGIKFIAASPAICWMDTPDLEKRYANVILR